MKKFAVLLAILVSGDLVFFSGAYSAQTWHITRAQLKAVQSYADDATASLIKGGN